MKKRQLDSPKCETDLVGSFTFFSFHYLKRGPVKHIHSVNYFSTHKTGSISHPGPVKSQYKERADKLVAEAEAKLR